MVIDRQDSNFGMKKGLQLKYTEFLCLPLHIEWHNPLAIAVAHRVHGQQMRTGCRISPRTLRDRIEEDNNVLIETRTSNFLKRRFDESFYSDLKTLVL